MSTVESEWNDLQVRGSCDSAFGRLALLVRPFPGGQYQIQDDMSEHRFHLGVLDLKTREVALSAFTFMPGTGLALRPKWTEDGSGIIFHSADDSPVGKLKLWNVGDAAPAVTLLTDGKQEDTQRSFGTCVGFDVGKTTGSLYVLLSLLQSVDSECANSPAVPGCVKSDSTAWRHPVDGDRMWIRVLKLDHVGNSVDCVLDIRASKIMGFSVSQDETRIAITDRSCLQVYDMSTTEYTLFDPPDSSIFVGCKFSSSKALAVVTHGIHKGIFVLRGETSQYWNLWRGFGNLLPAYLCWSDGGDRFLLQCDLGEYTPRAMFGFVGVHDTSICTIHLPFWLLGFPGESGEYLPGFDWVEP